MSRIVEEEFLINDNSKNTFKQFQKQQLKNYLNNINNQIQNIDVSSQEDAKVNKLLLFCFNYKLFRLYHQVIII